MVVNIRPYLFLLSLISVCGLSVNVMAQETESLDNLVNALSDAQVACTEISGELSELKRMAGINTAVSAVGTVGGGVALVTGIIKADKDKKVSDIIQNAINSNKEQAKQQLYGVDRELRLVSYPTTHTENKIYIPSSKTEEVVGKVTDSVNLGKVRTGAMAVAGASNIAGAVISAENASQGDLELLIADCSGAITKLNAAAAQVRVDGSDEQGTYLSKAEAVVSKCGQIKNINMSGIINKAKGSLVSNVVGATTGVVGAVISALANSKKIRGDKSPDGMQTEKNLNTTSNVLAGATTVASATSVIFNAAQISTIKKFVATVEECEEALR